MPLDDNMPPEPQSPMQEFAGMPWGNGEAADWAPEVAARVNAYDQQRVVANANDRAGQNLVGAITKFRDGLVQRTAADPHFADTALDVVQPTIAAFINAHPGIPDEDRQGHHDALVADLNNQIARTAVQSMAEQHAGAAHDMMADPRIGGALTDEDKTGLTSYIAMQHIARNADASAQQMQRTQAAQEASAAAAVDHADKLYDPTLGEPGFRPGWAQRIMADNMVQPADKAALMHLYGRLQTGGDAASSDPIMVQRILAGDMTHRDVLGEAGGALRLPDALNLARATLPQTVADQAKFSQVADTIQQARSALYGPNGENGAAGHAAWGRFVNWMLPTLRMGGADMGVPDIHPLNWLPRFQPTGDDVVPSAPESRPSLQQIFGR